MKMVKSLLLGSAAGLVAVAGAQAADLPVKAAPAQYVKICSLYGAGFYYVPGTDMCIKIGGWVRGYYAYNANGNSTTGNLVGNLNNNSTNIAAWRARGYITADAREQTEYGTVRGYIAVGLSGEAVQGGAAPTFSANRAFIQWAGFTFGLAQSFYDFYSAPATSYFGGYINPSSDTGDAGQYVAAYTMQFGNGWSATISAENPVFNRRSGVFNAGNVAFLGTTNTLSTIGVLTDSSGGITWPDVVGNIRIDQAWGSAQIMGAVHDVHALYYNNPLNVPGSNDLFGGPGDQVGWAVGGGLKLNAPMFGKGDYFQTQVNYTVGAPGYVIATNNRYAKFDSDSSYGTAFILDGVYGNNRATGGDIQLTTAWGVNAAYEHFWNPAWRTSVYGGYLHFEFNDTASNLLAASAVRSFGIPTGGTCGTATSAAGCFDANYWNVGTRTQWNVNKNFYMGVDVVYTRLDSALDGVTFPALPATGTRPGGAYTFGKQDAVTVEFRVHRDFYP